ncbi:MAG: glycosyltransferase family 2 protein [Pseudomonadota bacterium]
MSVVIPAFNRERTLPRAVRSVLQQGYANLELIVVDDCSTDRTAEVMAQFDDPRLRYVRLERNQGAAGARNEGIRQARGEYVAFQDSDDEWLADKLEKQVEAALAAAGQEVAVFHVKVVYGRDEARVYGPGRVVCVPRLSPAQQAGDFVKLTHRHNLISPQTLMFSRSVIEKSGMFDPLLRSNEDWDFALRLVRHAKVIFLDEPLVMTYILGDSISTLKLSGVRSMLRIILKLRRQADVDPGVLSDHFGVVGYSLSRLGKPKSGARFIRKAISYAPTRPKHWARLAMSLLGLAKTARA